MKGYVRLPAAVAAVLGAMFGVAPAFAQFVPRFETRSPRTCTPVGAKPSPEQAAALLQCRSESITEGEVSLWEKVRVQIGGPQAYNERTHAFLTSVDTTAKVYPIQGSYISYRCIRIKDSEKGKNCVTVTQPTASGFCWPTTFGTWDCVMSGSRSEVVPNQPPPT